MASSVVNTLTGAAKTHIVPAGRGFAFAVKAGCRLRIIDLHGEQVVDMMAWRATYSSDTSCEHFSTSYTRWFLGSQAPPAVDQFLYSNHARKMFKVVEDRVKVHAMQYMACNPGLYAVIGKPEHRSCAGNFAEAMTTYLHENVDPQVKFEWYQVHDPFNTFRNTPYYIMKGWMDSSKAGGFIEFEALMDSVIAVSCCSYEEGGFNGGISTDVAVSWQESA
ncbi:DUF1989 domain-containing protein [Fusarium falciforme]|uniref:DUF1989 domain-containing protein n=1 Tax=Fusarium falciforme TaxID=195108 RepID=UPI002300020A|nr:DUF1989 domain-containing protein [Fusarium falciforme]WAO96131.1 DUF1989 domain-containing protein [Fusarium falciforme]